MKVSKVSAVIERLTPIMNPDGTPVFRNDRIRSHRVILSSSPSFEKALAECEKLTRKDGQKKYFCLKRDDGKYAMDLTPQQVLLLTGGRVATNLFLLIAPGLTFNATVEFRDAGTAYINRKTKKEENVGDNGFAQVQDMSASIPPHVINQLGMWTAMSTAMTASFNAPTSVPQSVPQQTAEKIDNVHVIDEDIAGNAGDDAPAPAADTRARVGVEATS